MLRGNNLRYKMLPAGGAVNSLASGGTASMTTDAMVEPWRYARQAAVLVKTGTLNAATTLTVKVQGRLRSDHSTWNTLKDSGGVNDWALAAANLTHGGICEGVGAFGNFDVQRIDAALYDAVRFIIANPDTNAALVGVTQFLYELPQEPGAAVEDLFSLQPSPVISNT